MFSNNVPRERWSRFFSAPALFVAGVWIVMLGGALGFLGRFAVNVPFAEDGMLIPYVTGAEHLDMTFLWSPHSNHILPLPKLVLFLLARFTHDFRTSMYVGVLTCAAVALALAFAARSLRGCFDYTDAFFAIGLLHLGHWESFLIGFAIQEVMSTTLLALILVVILRSGDTLSCRQTLLVGLCLVLLPTTGMSGILLVPPLAVWLTYSAWVRWRIGGPGASLTIALALALALIAPASLTLYRSSMPHGLFWFHGSASAVEKVYTFFSVLLQTLTIGFGTSAATPWLPFLNGQRSFYLVGSVVLALVVVALIILLVRRQPPHERLRRAGLSLYLLANLLLLAGIAFGRCGISKTVGLSSRYALYSVPLLWGLYFVWQLYGTHFGGRLIPAGLFAFMCAMFSLNMYLGYDRGEARHALLKAVERDIVRAEVSDSAVARTYLRLTGNHWVTYKAGVRLQIAGWLKGTEKHDDPIRDEMTKMVFMLRHAGIPRRKHLP